MVTIPKEADLKNLGFLYPSRPAWDRGRKGEPPLLFEVSPSKDCVIFKNESHSMNNTYLYRNNGQFKKHWDQLIDAYEQVEVWNDMDIPGGPFTVPLSIAENMGSLRLYIRANRNEIRLSKKHCIQLNWMFSTALEAQRHWEHDMQLMYGEIPVMDKCTDV